jgi:hypothetical protein
MEIKIITVFIIDYQIFINSYKRITELPDQINENLGRAGTQKP